MGLEIGSVLEGKVTGITKFGAFVSLPEGKSGLVHISEIANSYVSDVNEHLQLGQSVKVRVMNVTEDGKINLSIKRAEERAPEARAPQRQSFNRRPPVRENSAPNNRMRQEAAAPPSENQQFEDRLKKFMQESDSRLASNPMYSDRKKRNRRR